MLGRHSDCSRLFSSLPNIPGIGRGVLLWYHNLVLLKTKLAPERASTSYHIHLDGHLGFGYSQYK